MEVTLVARDVALPDRFRDFVTEKSDRVLALAERARTFQIKVSRENSSRGGPSEDVVELTVIGKGPVIRAEARHADKYQAFDEALDHLVQRLRRAKDKRSPHHGQHRSKSMGEVSAEAFADLDLTPASVEVIRRVETGSIPVLDEAEETGGDQPESPVVIRRKVFAAHHLSAEEAVDEMELLGHDFFLYVDRESRQPSVVYRRRGWNYGVISLEES